MHRQDWAIAPMLGLSLQGCGLFPSFDGLTGGDAGHPDDASAPEFWCAGKPQFCDDFDQQPLTEKWSRTKPMGAGVNGSLDKDSAIAVSTPNSILVSLPAVAGGAETFLRLEKDFISPASSFVFGFDV